MSFLLPSIRLTLKNQVTGAALCTDYELNIY
jgi:hypothetical protein